MVFSLGGNRGNALFAAGQPSYAPMTCGSSGPPPSATYTTATGSLAYAAGSQRYTYSFPTRRAWAINSCWRINLGLRDGSTHTVNIRIIR